MPVWQEAVFGPCISSVQVPGKAVKTVRQRVSHAICGSTQEAMTKVDRKKTAIAPKIRITVRHVRRNAAAVVGRVDSVEKRMNYTFHFLMHECRPTIHRVPHQLHYLT